MYLIVGILHIGIAYLFYPCSCPAFLDLKMEVNICSSVKMRWAIDFF